MINSGWRVIREERRRQVEEHGYTEDFDRRHADSQLLLAARCYIDDLVRVREKKPGRTIPLEWPWGAKCWKPDPVTEQVKQLAKIGALIAAEIDRMQNQKTPRVVFGEEMEDQFRTDAQAELPKTGRKTTTTKSDKTQQTQESES